MSLLNGLLGSLLGGLSGNQQSSLLTSATSLIGQSGGIEGLMQKFGAQGLGHLVQGWIANGPNPPATPEHIEQVFSGQQLDQVAAQTGIDRSQVAAHLAQLLPQLVDKLTPHGQPVSGSALDQGLSSLLQGGIGKLFGA